MNIEELREYCLMKKGVSESLPFDEYTLVFKVLNKMFALVPLNRELSISLKCEPEKAIELREHYSYVLPAWHMSKKHWNTIIINNTVSNSILKKWIDDSYWIIANNLTKKQKEELESL